VIVYACLLAAELHAAQHGARKAETLVADMLSEGLHIQAIIPHYFKPEDTRFQSLEKSRYSLTLLILLYHKEGQTDPSWGLVCLSLVMHMEGGLGGRFCGTRWRSSNRNEGDHLFSCSWHSSISCAQTRRYTCQHPPNSISTCNHKAA
jgi:hypothetical protein